jgi:DNA-binding transcriptional LysR family regulator
LRLGQIRLLASVGELGQLRLVADALNVTPAAISKQVAEMENALARPIIMRVGNGVELTDLGRLLAGRSRELLDHLERTRVEVDELCSGVSGRIGIGAVPSVAPLLMPPLVLALKERAPNLSVRLQQGLFDRLAPMLTDGRIDLALARETAHVPLTGMVQREVLQDPLVILCGSQHALTRKSALGWADLKGSPWLLPVQGTPTYSQLTALMSRHGLSFPSDSVESNSWQVNVELLQCYPFVAAMPRAYARKFQASNDVTILSLSTDGMQAGVKAVWRKENSNPAIALLLDVLKQEVSRL